MYSIPAELYDLIHFQFKDYHAEARRLAELIRSLRPGARTVLDVACGTGEHARLLSDEHGFQVDGLDLNPTFAEVARGKLPRGTVFLGDMTDFSLPRRYDVVLCLFSSIGYARTPEGVTRALECFRAHLAAGGLLLVEPWFAPGVLDTRPTRVKVAEGDEVSVCRMSRLEIEGRLSRLRFEYLVGTSAGIEHLSEVHELGLLTTEEMLACFRAAGLHADHDPVGLDGRGLFSGREIPLVPL